MAIFDDMKTIMGRLVNYTSQSIHEASVLEVAASASALDPLAISSCDRGFGDDPNEEPYPITSVHASYASGSYWCSTGWTYDFPSGSYIEYSVGEAE